MLDEIIVLILRDPTMFVTFSIRNSKANTFLIVQKCFYFMSLLHTLLQKIFILWICAEKFGYPIILLTNIKFTLQAINISDLGMV